MSGWTKTPPTEPGWYKIKLEYGNWFGTIRYVYVDNYLTDKDMVFYEAGKLYWTGVESFPESEWQGPLEDL